ncbi:MAG: hypothetical protein IKU48_03550 [Clostridia bacterium]|nr:hypothetical protein [Clostridia bacterium]
MSSFDFLNKINMPIFVCGNEWKVIFRNSFCKKYTTAPRVNGRLSKYFVDGKNTVFPEKKSGIDFVACMFGDRYRIAMVFEYKSNAVVILPTLLEYDFLFGELSLKLNKDFANTFCEIFDLLSEEKSVNSDRYGVLEKLRSYYFGAIENYIAFLLFDSEKRVLGQVCRLYEFFLKNIVKVSNKSGLKIETRLTSIEEGGKNIYTDTLYFTFVLSGILLFGAEISKDKKCIVEPISLGEKVRHTIKVTCKCPELYGKTGVGLNDFKEFYPMGYFNVIPYEALCSALGWRLCYDITDAEEMNCAVYFDIDNDNEMLFKSAGAASNITAEELVADIISRLFLF